MAISRQEVVQTAEKLVSKGRLEAAIDEYRKVLEASPNDTSTLNRVGDLYARLNRVHKATELFRQTAENFARQGFFVKAIAIYKKIIRLDPSQIAAYENLADLYHKQGLSNDAVAQYQVVADYYVKHGDRRSALSVYRNMVGVEPSNPSYRLRLAGLFQDLGDATGALEQYEQIALLMLEHGRAEEAAQVYTSALDLGAPSPEFVARAVRSLREAGHAPGADRVLRLSAERQPSAAVVARSLLTREREDLAPPPAPPAVPSWLAEAPPETVLDTPEELPASLAAAPVEMEEQEEVLLDLDSPELAGGALADLLSEAEAALPEVAAEPEGGAGPFETFATFEFEIEETQVGFLAEPEAPPAETAPLETEMAVASEPEAALAPHALFVADDRPLEIALRIDGLLLDAEVLTRYQMEELAVACLEQVLELDPDHVDGLGRLIDLQLTLGRRDEALAMANRFAELALRSGEPVVWGRVTERMLSEGFRHDDGRFLAVVIEPPVVEAEIPLPEVVEPEIPTPEAAAPAAGEVPEDLMVRWRREIAPRLGALVDAAELAKLAGRPAVPPTPPAGTVDLSSLAEQLLAEIGDIEPERGGEPRPFAIPPPALERPGADEFFDLATELEAELLSEDFGEDLLPPVQEQTIEEIVEGFRRGMEKSLSAEDYDTHYNLGIAYQEMGLLDEAIGEFQLAAKEPRYLVECCSLLAACFEEKGYPELAVHWYERGLDSPSLQEEERWALLYELGNLELALDERESARRRFIELYGLSSTYRDVVAKLEELGRPSL